MELYLNSWWPILQTKTFESGDWCLQPLCGCSDCLKFWGKYTLKTHQRIPWKLMFGRLIRYQVDRLDSLWKWSLFREHSFFFRKIQHGDMVRVVWKKRLVSLAAGFRGFMLMNMKFNQLATLEVNDSWLLTINIKKESRCSPSKQFYYLLLPTTT